MKILDLVLKGKWYDLIQSGEKREEYREIKPYWIKRLCFTRIDNPYIYCVKEKCCAECFADACDDWMAYPFDAVRFHRGYTNTTMLFEIKSMHIGIGNPDWGAPEDKEVFIIKLGKRL